MSKPTEAEPARSTRPLQIVLAGLVGAALAGGVFLLTRSCDGNGGGDNEPKPPPPPPVKAEQLKRYKVGDIYRTMVNTSVHGPVEGKDWGIKGKGTMIFRGEMDIVREVLEPEDDTVEVDPETDVKLKLDVRRARDITVSIDLEDAELDMPPLVGNALTYTTATVLAAQSGGAAAPAGIIITREVLKKKWVRGALIDAIDWGVQKLTGKPVKEFFLPRMPSIAGYEGCGATFVYRGGEGLLAAETYGSLDREQENRLKAFSIFAESYLLPSPEEGGPDEWEVDVRTIAHLLVPTSDVDVEGKLRFARREKQGDILHIECIEGLVDFVTQDGGSETLASWAARGSLYYDVRQNVVTKGKLTGEVLLHKRSTDHVLFEASWKAEPKYSVLIWGERPPTATEAKREVEPFELDL